MTILRTPDDRFHNLPGYDFAPHYIDIGDTRMHYVDEGDGAETVLCLHGEPTWSYLYRHMIPPLAERHRVVAPDMVGFGKSDKYPALEDYSFQMHYDKLVGLIDALDLHNITLICQDWGGLLGLTIAANHGDRFARLVVLNTFLPTGKEKISEAFMQWRAFSQKVGTRMQIGRLIAQTISNYELPADVIAAYDAPFPEDSYKAGAAVFSVARADLAGDARGGGDEGGARSPLPAGGSRPRSCSAMAIPFWAERPISSADCCRPRATSRKSPFGAPGTFCKRKKAPRSPLRCWPSLSGHTALTSPSLVHGGRGHAA